MAVPTFDQVLRPLLTLAAERPITRRTATEAMSAHFALSDTDQLLRIPSGASTLVANRTGWAMTFLTKAALIAKSAPKTYSATERGVGVATLVPSAPNGAVSPNVLIPSGQLSEIFVDFDQKKLHQRMGDQ